MTAEEFIRDHGDGSGAELIHGRFVRIPMPGPRHGEVGMTAGILIGVHVKQRKCGRVFGLDTYMQTRPDGVRGADVAYLSYDRFPKEHKTPHGVMPAPPELVIEVKSPTDRWKYIRIKVDEYLAYGVTAVGLIDPDLESLTVFRDDEFPQTFHNGDTVEFPDVLPGFAVPLKSFFE